MTSAGIRERIDAQLLIQLTDPNGVTLDETKLARAVTDASGQVEGYLYRLPAADRPPLAAIEAHTIAIVLYSLAGNRPGVEFDSIRARYAAAIKWLEGLAGGVGLGFEAQADVPPARFDDVSLGDFGGDNLHALGRLPP